MKKLTASLLYCCAVIVACGRADSPQNDTEMPPGARQAPPASPPSASLEANPTPTALPEKKAFPESSPAPHMPGASQPTSPTPTVVPPAQFPPEPVHEYEDHLFSCSTPTGRWEMNLYAGARVRLEEGFADILEIKNSGDRTWTLNLSSGFEPVVVQTSVAGAGGSVRVKNITLKCDTGSVSANAYALAHLSAAFSAKQSEEMFASCNTAHGDKILLDMHAGVGDGTLVIRAESLPAVGADLLFVARSASSAADLAGGVFQIEGHGIQKTGGHLDSISTLRFERGKLAGTWIPTAVGGFGLDASSCVVDTATVQKILSREAVKVEADLNGTWWAGSSYLRFDGNTETEDVPCLEQCPPKAYWHFEFKVRAADTFALPHRITHVLTHGTASPGAQQYVGIFSHCIYEIDHQAHPVRLRRACSAGGFPADFAHAESFMEFVRKE